MLFDRNFPTKLSKRQVGVPVLLAGLVVAFFWKLLFWGGALGGLDVLDYFYPYRTYAARAITHGRLPLWNPDYFGGVPFLANIQTAIFYPLSLLFYLLNAPTAYTWSILIHLFGGGLFTYLFARRSLGLRTVPALISGVIFAFGGSIGGQLDHLNQFSAMIWLPALLLCWDEARGGRRPFIFATAGILAIQFLAGHTQQSYFELVAWGLYALFHEILDARRQGLGSILFGAASFIAALVLGVGMATVQLLPTSELAAWSIRSGGLTYPEVTSLSLSVPMLYRALLPPFWDRGFLVPPGSEFLGYTSVIALVLAQVAIVYRWRTRQVIFFAGLGALSLVLALGKQTSLFHLLYSVVPGFNLFRVPARWLFLFSLSVAMLAGIGADAAFGLGRKLPWRRLAAIVFLAGVLGLVFSLTQTLPAGRTLLTWFILGIASSLVVFGGMNAKRPARFEVASLALLVVDLWLAGQSLDYNQPVPSEVFGEELPTLQFLKQQGGEFRVISVASDTFVPAVEPSFRQIHAPKLSGQQMLDYLRDYKLREIVEPNTSLMAGIATIDGYDGGLLPLARYVDFKNILTGRNSAPDDRIRFVLKWLPVRPLLDLANVRYVVMDKLSDKRADGVDYDLSSFLEVNPQTPEADMELKAPVAADAIGMVTAFKPGEPLVGDEVGTLILNSTDGTTRSIPIAMGGGNSFGELPYAERLPTFLQTVDLGGSLQIESIRLELNIAGDLYLNGLALIDARSGAHPSPLMAPGAPMSKVYDGDVKIYENGDVQPRAFLVHDAVEASTPQDALNALRTGSFDPKAEAVIETTVRQPESHSLSGRLMGRIARLFRSGPESESLPPAWFQSESSSSAGSEESVTIKDYQPERVVIDTAASRPGFLVLTDSYFPGWRVTVDGQPQRLLAADYLFRAVHVDAGRHTVVFAYQPASFQLGAVISLAALGVCILGFFFTRGQGRQDH